MSYDFLGSAYIKTTISELNLSLSSIRDQTLKPNKVVLVVDGPLNFNLENLLKDFKRNLNLYVISEDQDGDFIDPPTSLLNNLKTWLNRYKMINDTIDILPAKIVNLKIDFEVLTDLESNRFDVINLCIEKLKDERDLKEKELKSILDQASKKDELIDEIQKLRRDLYE